MIGLLFDKKDSVDLSSRPALKNQRRPRLARSQPPNSPTISRLSVPVILYDTKYCLQLTLMLHSFAAVVDYNNYKFHYYSNAVDADASVAVKENKRLIASRRSSDDLMRFRHCLSHCSNCCCFLYMAKKITMLGDDDCSIYILKHTIISLDTV
jgi:hypothetical protein